MPKGKINLLFLNCIYFMRHKELQYMIINSLKASYFSKISETGSEFCVVND